MNAIAKMNAKKERNMAAAAFRLRQQQKRDEMAKAARQATVLRLYNGQQEAKRLEAEAAYVSDMLAGPHRDQLLRFLAGRPATYARVSRFVPRKMAA